MPKFSVLRQARRKVLALGAAFSLSVLAACEPVAFGGPVLNTSAPVQVALLVPRGSQQGGDALLADSLEKAARLAIADLQEGVTVDLRVYPTAGNPEQAASQAVQAVNDGAKIILGPVYAEAANAVGNAVASRNINVLAFSNNPTIAGGNVFVLGPTFQNTANRLTRYARSQGRSNIVVVHGADVAGQLGRNAIQSAATSAGSRVSAVVPYQLSQQSVIDAIPQVREAVTLNGADTVFMTANTAGALPLLTQLLPESGVTPDVAQYIGLTRWDIPLQTTALPGVQNGWFALPDPTRSAQFRSRYEGAYGDRPHPIGGLAYDGIAAVGALVSSGRSNALSTASLTQGAGFQGVNGIFRLRADGTNERGLAVATIQNKQVVVIDPAPRSFTGLGF